MVPRPPTGMWVSCGGPHRPAGAFPAKAPPVTHDRPFSQLEREHVHFAAPPALPTLGARASYIWDVLPRLVLALNVVGIQMPPLASARDISALAQAFIGRCSGELKKKIEDMTPDAQKLLMRYDGPGNTASSKTRSNARRCYARAA